MKSEVEGLPDLHAFVKINNYVSRFSFPAMSLPKIAEALIPRPIPDNKMWFNPLAPVTSTPAPSPAPETPKTEAKPRKKAKQKAEDSAAESKPNAGAPLKEAKAIVPKPEPELPQVVVPAAQTQAPSLSLNL